MGIFGEGAFTWLLLPLCGQWWWSASLQRLIRPAPPWCGEVLWGDGCCLGGQDADITLGRIRPLNAEPLPALLTGLT